MKIINLDGDIDIETLKKYGFKNNLYEKYICDNNFKVVVTIKDNKMLSKIIDLEFNDEYLMADVKDFNNSIKEEYENILNDILNKCIIKNKYISKKTIEVVKYVKNKYNTSLEFLWEKYDNYGVMRNKKGKWYGIIMVIPKDKLGIDSDELIEILDLRYNKDDNQTLKIYPGWHMNKKNWITVILDGSVNDDDLYNLIDDSYNISNIK